MFVAAFVSCQPFARRMLAESLDNLSLFVLCRSLAGLALIPNHDLRARIQDWQDRIGVRSAVGR